MSIFKRKPKVVIMEYPGPRYAVYDRKKNGWVDINGDLTWLTRVRAERWAFVDTFEFALLIYNKYTYESDYPEGKVIYP